MAKKPPRTAEQKAESAAKAKETKAKTAKAAGIASRMQTAPAEFQPTTVRQRLEAKYASMEEPEALANPYPSMPRTGRRAGIEKAKQTSAQTKDAEVLSLPANPVGNNPLGRSPLPPPTTTSEGLRIGTPPRTRGHANMAEHVRQLEATAALVGASSEVSTHGRITGLSGDSPVVPPGPVKFRDPDTKEIKRGVGYTHRADKSAPVYSGGNVPSRDMTKWGQQGRPDLLDVIQQHQTISTPGGLSRGIGDRVDTSPGSRGEFSGMNPEELETAVKAEVLPDRISSAVRDLMRPSNYHRARNVIRPEGGGRQPWSSKQTEMTNTVRVTQGGRTENLTQEQHSQRAEKRIAKRDKGAS